MDNDGDSDTCMHFKLFAIRSEKLIEYYFYLNK